MREWSPANHGQAKAFMGGLVQWFSQDVSPIGSRGNLFDLYGSFVFIA